MLISNEQVAAYEEQIEALRKEKDAYVAEQLNALEGERDFFKSEDLAFESIIGELENKLEVLQEGEKALETFIRDLYEAYTQNQGFEAKLRTFFDITIGRVI